MPTAKTRSYRGGLKVHTTLNPAFQKFAEDAVDKGLRDLDKRRGWRKDKANVLDDKEFQKRTARSRNTGSGPGRRRGSSPGTSWTASS